MISTGNNIQILCFVVGEYAKKCKKLLTFFAV